jgi:tetrathionate reductase subunit B
MSELTNSQVTRRHALRGAGVAVAAAGAATALVPKTAAAEMAPPRDAPRWVMVMDLRKCIGCRACTIACKQEFEVPIGHWRAVIQEKMHGMFPTTKKTFVPLMCNHCEGNAEDEIPPCVKACPQYPGKRATYVNPDGKKIRYRTGATYKRPDGMILLDNEQCIGCGRCIDACPYGVRSFNPLIKAGEAPDKNGIVKCTMCQHRVDNGLEPACVNTCQGRARIFGNMKDPGSEVAKLIQEWKLAENRDKTTLLPKAGTFPHVFYIDPDDVLKIGYTPRKPKKLDHFRDEIT